MAKRNTNRGSKKFTNDPTPESVTPETQSEDTMNEINDSNDQAAEAPTSNVTTFQRKQIAKSGKNASYRVPGIAAVIKVSRALLAEGAEFPETFDVTGFPFAEPKVKAKLTPEEIAERRAERKAKLAKMSPAERLAAQQERLQKQLANLAKRREQLGLELED